MLEKCNNCEQNISHKAVSCPHCGSVKKRHNNQASTMLERCSDCGNGISQRAVSCPQCGAPRGHSSPQAATTNPDDALTDETIEKLGIIASYVLLSLAGAFFFGEQIVIGTLNVAVRIYAMFSGGPMWVADLALFFTDTSEITDNTVGVFFMAFIILYMVISLIGKILK